MTQQRTYPTREEIDKVLCLRHTPEVSRQLKNGRVAVIGLGGLGSGVAAALARAGVGHLHLVDYDRVELSNLNRQQYRIKDIGSYKTDALQEIIKDINPYLDITTDTLKVDEKNYAALFAQENIICEAVDQPEAKAMLFNSFIENYRDGHYLVAASGMAGYGSSNTIITRKIGKGCYLCGDAENGLESGIGLMAPRVGVCLAHQANMILRLLLGEEKS